MLSASRAYDIDAYQRTNHGIGLGYRHSALADDYIESDYGVKRASYVPDSETKAPTTHRKRVPVACERCRKRKIKCSGDQGDGRGCDNCKSAGWEGCQFLRVRSELLQCHPTISTSRAWHGPHYHPYSRVHRNTHHLQNSPAYISSNNMTYPTWHNEVDYSGLTANASAASWASQNYITPYTMYDTEDMSSYTAQPPSYMLPDPDQNFHNGMNSNGSLSRTQQGGLWPSQVTSTNSVPSNSRFARSGYTMQNGQVAKPYTLIPLSTSFSIDRNIPNASLHSSISAIPSSIDDRSPISAASHQSSHTWNTETTTSTGNLSSQTSCGDIQDISSIHRNTTSDDQGALYPYISHRGSPQIATTAGNLSTAKENPGSQPLLTHSEALRSDSGVTYSDTDVAGFQGVQPREYFRTSSPSLYGYANRHRNLYYEVVPKRSVGDSTSYHWHGAQNAASGQSDGLLGEQQPQPQLSTDLSRYPVADGAVASHIATSIY